MEENLTTYERQVCEHLTNIFDGKSPVSMGKILHVLNHTFGLHYALAYPMARNWIEYAWKRELLGGKKISRTEYQKTEYLWDEL